MLLKSTLLDGYYESETFVAIRINELLDDFTKINIHTNYSSDSTSSYNSIGELECIYAISSSVKMFFYDDDDYVVVFYPK